MQVWPWWVHLFLGLGHELDELVHDVKSQEASDINNNGKRSQVDFLLSVGFTQERLAECKA